MKNIRIPRESPCVRFVLALLWMRLVTYLGEYHEGEREAVVREVGLLQLLRFVFIQREALLEFVEQWVLVQVVKEDCQVEKENEQLQMVVRK